MAEMRTRTEHDSMGPVAVPENALWGAQTQRAIDNFQFSELRFPRAFLRALGLVKASAAHANRELGVLGAPVADAVAAAAERVAAGEVDDAFAVDVFQTGSGTSTNMNANEVIARLASDASGQTVHPNDHVNASQSSNDVIPTTIHVAALLAVEEALLPALTSLGQGIRTRAGTLAEHVKTGRTHLMDAMPVRLDQEAGAWATQIELSAERLRATLPRLCELAQGGTAVGSGVNAPEGFAKAFCEALSERTGQSFTPARDTFAALACQDTAVELSGQLRALAVAQMKIANDLRWMNSGPLAGLGEIALPAIQPGSSIMPGKVNPVLPEAVCMVAAQVMGNDVTVGVAGQSGSFQLNVMLPVIAYNLLQSIALQAAACEALEPVIAGFEVRAETLVRALERNPILVTALNREIGYDKGAAIAKRAYAEGRNVLDVALEDSGLSEERLRELLDPRGLTG
ncbi:class II fumarate hydratase [Algiphilus sp.]|uniref:class II fumarate hydratase n=1 Tax=Algiphilus sp. TaxID=1872431 RepID=UPI0025BA7F47|nr:class II fumarate hydratase [Algiphilus sp.]MCK5770236.1 class II fumarate hydratase [Algiphilus sp.]